MTKLDFKKIRSCRNVFTFCEGLFSIILKLIGCHIEALLPTAEDYKYTYGL